MSKGRFFCFSPPVMLATFIIEICLAIYAILRYKLNEVGRLIVAILVCLAAFQIAEYNVCASGWIDSLLASRLGYIAISLLPPLGLHLTYALANTKKRPLMWPAYGAGAAFVVFFLWVGNSLSGHTCQGNYVIFQMVPGAAVWYGLYYYGLLFVGIAESLRLAQGKAEPVRRALKWLIIGYLAFMVPTTTVNFLNRDTLTGIPSVMCGFAVLLALTRTMVILPLRGTKR